MFNDASPDVEADGQSGYHRHSPLSAAAPEVVKAVEAGRLRAHLKLGLFKSELWEICGKPLLGVNCRWLKSAETSINTGVHNGRPEWTRTIDLFRVNFEVNNPKPYLAFPRSKSQRSEGRTAD